jgi:adenine-specific DNA-methyltransferase
MKTSKISTSNDYIYQPMMSYLGNKRKLLDHIEKYVEKVKPQTALDGFCGSGVVARLFKCHVDSLIINDLEPYSVAIQKTYLANENSSGEFNTYIENLNKQVDTLKVASVPFISKYYAPKDTENIQKGERCFYSRENAIRIDNYIQLLKKEKHTEFRDMAIGNLLVKCSINTNTSGVFKAFYKVDDVGHWGGYKEHDLQRILKEIRVEKPILCDKSCEVVYSNNEIMGFWKKYKQSSEKPIDFVYYDPPYNQHPYGSNYFMLNVIYKAIMEKDYIKEFKIDDSSVSGIPKDWNRSTFNYKKSALDAFKLMIEETQAKHILISYNDNGMISKEEIMEILGGKGEVSVEEIVYKNLNSRPNKKMADKVNEYLFFVEVN